MINLHLDSNWLLFWPNSVLAENNTLACVPRPASELGVDFCSPYITYNIDSRLNNSYIDSRVKVEMDRFLEFNSTKHWTADCIAARTRLSCSLVMPYCSDATDYVVFPCRDLCVDYYRRCGFDAQKNVSDVACETLPTANCLSLRFWNVTLQHPNTNAGLSSTAVGLFQWLVLLLASSWVFM